MPAGKAPITHIHVVETWLQHLVRRGHPKPHHLKEAKSCRIRADAATRPWLGPNYCLPRRPNTDP